MNTTTLFDLDQTAAPAALSALGKTSLQVESIRLAAFEAAGHDPLDFDQWSQYYQQHMTNYTTLKRTPSPAAKAAPNKPVALNAVAPAPAAGSATPAT